MTKLVDQFGTQYFASHYAGEVKSFLSTVKQVDLAGARICRDVMKHITSAAYEGVEVHDTEDPEREAYFEENRRRLELQKSCPTSVPLPLPSTAEDAVNVINSLDPSRLYHMENGRADADRAFAFIVQAARPEIKIDLRSSVGELFKLIADNLYPNSHRWEESALLLSCSVLSRASITCSSVTISPSLPSLERKTCLSFQSGGIALIGW